MDHLKYVSVPLRGYFFEIDWMHEVSIGCARFPSPYGDIFLKFRRD